MRGEYEFCRVTVAKNPGSVALRGEYTTFLQRKKEAEKETERSRRRTEEGAGEDIKNRTSQKG